MLDKIKNVSSMIQTANKLKQQQERLQKILSTIRVNGQSKNQKVTVTITGEQKIVNIQIAPELINFVYENFTSQGKEESMLAKAIMEAFEDAISKVQGEVVKKMQETGSLDDFMSMLQAVTGK
jgi:DNA-binding protein YbaB